MKAIAIDDYGLTAECSQAADTATPVLRGRWHHDRVHT